MWNQFPKIYHFPSRTETIVFHYASIGETRYTCVTLRKWFLVDRIPYSIMYCVRETLFKCTMLWALIKLFISKWANNYIIRALVFIPPEEFSLVVTESIRSLHIKLDTARGRCGCDSAIEKGFISSNNITTINLTLIKAYACFVYQQTTPPTLLFL